MYRKIDKIIGAMVLALLLVIGLITSLSNAAPPSISRVPAGPEISGITHPPAIGSAQEATCPQFNNISGATFDPATNELIIIGRNSNNLPSMSFNYLQENLAVAMRAVHGEPEYPAVTIGTTPSPDPSVQLVEYFGNITDTHFGYVFFEADRLLKSYSMGRDNLNPTAPFTSSVPGYISFFDRYMALEDTTPTPVSQRFWFSPTLNLETIPGNPYGFVFSNTKVNLNWAYIQGSSTSAKAEQAANDFVNHFNAHYDEFAAEQAARGNQTFYELVQLFKLFGVAHWTSIDSVQLNISGLNGPWLSDYPVASVTTPDTTPTVSRTDEFFTGGFTYTIVISGGVTVEDPNINPNINAMALVDEAKNKRNGYSYKCHIIHDI